MPEFAYAEALLARVTTEARASAILGDLEELAATRGRLWFWTMYLRALISLGWRTGGSAVFLALVCKRFLFGPALALLMSRRTSHLRDASPFGMDNQHVSIFCFNLSLVIAELLIFMLPFVFIRFGCRDRLTQLACVLSLIALPAFSLRPWLLDLSGILIVLAIVAALVFSCWRRPMILLAAAFLTAAAAKIAWMCILIEVFHQSVIVVSTSRKPICDAMAFAMAAEVCLRLHRRLFRPRLNGVAHA